MLADLGVDSSGSGGTGTGGLNLDQLMNDALAAQGSSGSGFTNSDEAEGIVALSMCRGKEEVRCNTPGYSGRLYWELIFDSIDSCYNADKIVTLKDGRALGAGDFCASFDINQIYTGDRYFYKPLGSSTPKLHVSSNARS